MDFIVIRKIPVNAFIPYTHYACIYLPRAMYKSLSQIHVYIFSRFMIHYLTADKSTHMPGERYRARKILRRDFENAKEKMYFIYTHIERAQCFPKQYLTFHRIERS